MKHIGLKLLAILCAVSLWFFVVSMKTYEVEMDIPLVIEHLPSNMAFANAVPTTVRTTLEGSGIDLIRLHFQDSLALIRINLNHAELGETSISLRPELFHCSLNKIRLRSTEISKIPLEIDTKITLPIPVRLSSELRPAADYLLVGEPVVIPNTVQVEGARKTLTKVFEITTSTTPISGLKKSDTLHIPLALEGLPNQLHIQTNEISVAVHIEKRITRTFDSIPIQLVGPYQRGVHSISPDRVQLKIVGGRETLLDLKAEDVRLFMEFTRFELEHSNQLLPTLAVDKPIESWSIKPETVSLVVGNP